MKVLRFDGPGNPRLDAFLREALPELPPGLLHKYLRQNKIKLNGKKQPLGTRLAAGDEVRLFLPPGAEEAGPAGRCLRVLYEDERLLAADKPAGLASLAGAGQDSLLALARRHLGQAEGGTDGVALCHRLDTGTNGVLLLAKDAEALAFVTGLIRQQLIQKTYYGVTVGRLSPPGGRLEGFLWKDAKQGMVRSLPRPTPGAKSAVLEYETLATSGRLALMQLRPHTGRTHQIRVQLAAAGVPLLGDSKYGTAAVNRRLRCRYQCLCAGQLDFPPIESGPFASYSGLQIACEKPWFYEQVQDGQLALE